jgi:hypothetical protein
LSCRRLRPVIVNADGRSVPRNTCW